MEQALLSTRAQSKQPLALTQHETQLRSSASPLLKNSFDNLVNLPTRVWFFKNHQFYFSLSWISLHLASDKLLFDLLIFLNLYRLTCIQNPFGQVNILASCFPNSFQESWTTILLQKLFEESASVTLYHKPVSGCSFTDWSNLIYTKVKWMRLGTPEKVNKRMLHWKCLDDITILPKFSD